VFRYLLAAALVVGTGAAQPSLVIALDGEPPSFRVRGSGILPRLNNPNFQQIFQVSVDQPGVPPVAGTYAMQDGVMVFTPRFPLQPGVVYRARYKLAGESAERTFTIPKPVIEPTTFIEHVYPTVSTLPENQLKLYIHFSAPMSKGEAYKRMRLVEAGGGEVKLPFLELDEELWDREYKRLTVLFDPGRIKRDLVPNREVGPPLQEGRNYTLVIDKEWADARGAPLKSEYRKEIKVGPPDRTPLDPKTWRLAAPAAGTDPVILDFPEPIDAALLQRFIDVVNHKGDRVDGQVTVERQETRWIFKPDQAWSPGDYKLEIVSTLEDLAGNKIGKAFDVDVFEQVERQITIESYTLPFTVAPK
jgi:hypothetical protein